VQAQPAPAPTRPSVRSAVWALHVALPLLGLWLLIAQPRLDVHWQHPPSHFWIVAVVAGVNLLLGVRMNQAARGRADARLFLVSLAFLASAGFLFLHALATPGVLLHRPNGGFVVAMPVGLALASVFALASSYDLSEWVLRRQALLRGGLALLLAAWAAASLLGLPPLRTPPTAGEAEGPLLAVTFVSVAVYILAALRYFGLYRRRPSAMLASIITAFVLLAEAMVAVAVSGNWRLSWWEWHLLMTLAFGFVAYSAYVQYQREGSAAGLFDSITLEQTARRIQARYGEALEALVTALRQRERDELSERGAGPLTAGLADQFGLTEGQVAVLDRAGEALAAERDQLRRLAALVGVGQQARVGRDEDRFLDQAIARIAEGFAPDEVRIGLMVDGRLRYPASLDAGRDWEVSGAGHKRALAAVSETLEPAESGDGLLVLPLTVERHLAGLLEVRRVHGRPFAERDRSVLVSLASQLSIALENVRLYRQIDALFRQYMSPDVASALLADPAQAALGGAVVEVTVLFADLRGFTSLSERSSPEELVALLNRYFGAAVPCILDEGGTVVQFIGDAVMALFNAPARQPDHALRAAQAALAMQAAIEREARDAGDAGDAGDGPELPRFRIGVNTGQALVGNVGSERIRSFSAMGDAINVAARLESIATPGQVVIAEPTRAAIGRGAVVETIGVLTLKGRSEPVLAHVLRELPA